MDIVLADVMGHGAPAALVAADGEDFGICGSACGLFSVEELVAEMGAAALCVIARIANKHTDRLHPELDL
jgi:hypothetical protein